MNSKIVFSIFVLALLAVGCISEFNAKLPSGDKQIMIVNGNIMEDSTVIFTLSKSFPLDSTYSASKNSINNASVTLIGSNGYQSPPAQNMGNGAYQISIGKLDDGVEYGIQITYDGDTYQSALSKPLHTPEIDSISWIQPQENATVTFQVSTHDDQDGAKFFMWSYAENWETMATYYTTVFLDPKTDSFYNQYPPPYYYCWKSNASNKFLIGSTESLNANKIINKQLYQSDPGDSRFSKLYCVTLNQIAISKAAYEYYQNKITLNEDMGGLFTPQPSELSGNIACVTNSSKKVIGYVEVIKNVTQKRLFVYPGQITHPLYYSCSLITQDSILTYMNLYGYTYKDIYGFGYRPANSANVIPGSIVPENWSTANCTDCVMNGGTKNKPDFWPNDDQ